MLVIHDNQTFVNLAIRLVQEGDGMNMVDSYSVDGFRLTNDTKVLGPCIIFPNAVLKWAVTGIEDLTGRDAVAFADYFSKFALL